MNIPLSVHAINFVALHPNYEPLLVHRDHDPNLILLQVSCTQYSFEDGNGSYLQVLFDYRIKNNVNSNGPDVYVNLIMENEKFVVIQDNIKK